VHSTVLKENAENTRILAKSLLYTPHEGVPTLMSVPSSLLGLYTLWPLASKIVLTFMHRRSY